MSHIVTKPAHGVAIAKSASGEEMLPTHAMQVHLDDLTESLNGNLLGVGVGLESYEVASLPAVPTGHRQFMIFVEDESGGAVPAFSDGTNWRRVTDRAIVS